MLKPGVPSAAVGGALRIRRKMLGRDLRDMLLHVAALAGPVGLGAAERRDVLEVLMLGGLPREEVLIVELGGIARAVDQPDLSSAGERRPVVRKQMLDEAAHRRNPGAGRDQDRVGQAAAAA